jgi:hypothetical protein
VGGGGAGGGAGAGAGAGGGATERRGAAGAGCGAGAGGGGEPETEVTAGARGFRFAGGWGLRAGRDTRFVTGSASTTGGRPGSTSERPWGEVAGEPLKRMGTVTRVPRASVRTTPLVNETSFGLMQIPLLADTHP